MPVLEEKVMRLMRALVVLVLPAALMVSVLMATAPPASAASETIMELWRSRFGATEESPSFFMDGSQWLAANPNDGSFWMTEGGMVTHIAANGELIARSPGLARPSYVAVNPVDGTCWAAGAPGYQAGWVAHLAPDGRLLSLTRGLDGVTSITFSPHDGSVWVTGQGDQRYLAHLSPAGALLSTTTPVDRVVVDPNDGRRWQLAYNSSTYDTEVTCFNPDESEAWRYAASSVAYAAEDVRDQSLWIAGNSSRIVHLSSSGAVLWQGTTHGMGWLVAFWVSPHDGSVWASSYSPGEDGGCGVLHFSSAGEELLAVPGEIVGRNDADDTAWVMTWDEVTGLAQWRQFDTSGAVLRSFTTAPWLLNVAYLPTDNSFWGIGRPSTRNLPLHLYHLGPDGSILSDTRWQSWSLIDGDSLSAEDGALWVQAGERWVPLEQDAVRLSPTGQELERRPDFAPVSHPRVTLSPWDGSWWNVYEAGAGSPYLPWRLTHYAPDGTVLQSIDNAVLTYVISPLDGSVWGQMSPGDGSGHYTTTLSRVSASGELVWQRTYPQDTSVEGPVLKADGSAWVIAHYTSGARREHFAADGTYLGDLPLTPEMTGSVTYTGDALTAWTEAADGTIYAAFAAFDSSGLGTDSGARRFSQDGALLWEWRRGLPEMWANDLALDPSDGSVWVCATGLGYSVDAYVAHLSTDGALLGISDAFLNPYRLLLDPRDGSVWVEDSAEAQIVHLKAFTGPFSDVPADYWAADAIAACKEAGVVTGYPDGSFRPKGVMTRDLMAAYLARVRFGGDAAVPPGPATPTFSDVPPSHPAYRHIEYCYAQGIVTGYSWDNSYRPNEPVTRGQMAAFLARAKCGGEEFVPSGPAAASFPDVAPDFKFYRHIEWIYAQGITTGKSDGLYHPEESCLREQMAVFVARAFELL